MKDIEMSLPGEIVTLNTRHDSHDVVDKERRYKQIVEIMKEHSEPMTAKEISVAMWIRNYTPTSERNFAAPRLTELSQKGVVEPIGKTKCKYTGKTVAVYHLIECHE